MLNKIFFIIIKKKKDTNQISKIFRKKYKIKLKCFVGDLRDRYYAQYNSYNAHGMPMEWFMEKTFRSLDRSIKF